MVHGLVWSVGGTLVKAFWWVGVLGVVIVFGRMWTRYKKRGLH
jgi:hypothetical protein